MSQRYTHNIAIWRCPVCQSPFDRTTYGMMTEWPKRHALWKGSDGGNRFPPLKLSRSFDEPPSVKPHLKPRRQSRYVNHGSEIARETDLGEAIPYGHRPSVLSLFVCCVLLFFNAWQYYLLRKVANSYFLRSKNFIGNHPAM